MKIDFLNYRISERKPEDGEYKFDVDLDFNYNFICSIKLNEEFDLHYFVDTKYDFREAESVYELFLNVVNQANKFENFKKFNFKMPPFKECEDDMRNLLMGVLRG
jgi:hypothetical protein